MNIPDEAVPGIIQDLEDASMLLMNYREHLHSQGSSTEFIEKTIIHLSGIAELLNRLKYPEE